MEGNLLAAPVKNLTKDALSKVVTKIVEHFQPEKIILFGSHAWGEPTTYSDVDILVVMDVEGSLIRKEAEIYRIARPKLVPMDIIVRTPEQIHYRLKIGDPFIQRIIREGEVLYERRVKEWVAKAEGDY
ncbi:MAG: nucleotidyltransferase domain-containing protein [Theionarchaea archaeon]|nr:nucleotidyltransferase domain-containing protein [Theionarchaea archaeon]